MLKGFLILKKKGWGWEKAKNKEYLIEKGKETSNEWKGHRKNVNVRTLS
jgi:hypothetical protein